MDDDPLQCSICRGEFDLEQGGSVGYFGILPVQFCVWCLASIFDMVEQSCDRCLEAAEADG